MLKRIITITIATTLIACNSSAPDANTANETKPDSAKSEVSSEPTNGLADFEFHTLVVNIPSPFEIITLLPKANIPFNKGLINATDNESKYVTSTKKGLNYGSYIVDLVYLSSNEQFSNVKTYFKTSRNMAQSLGCADSFDKIAGNRLEKNIDKKDTINKVIDQIYLEMDGYLRTNDRLLSATQILVGSWVESQYITVSLIKDETKNKDNAILFQKVSEQGSTIDKLVELLKEFEKEKDFLPVINELKDLSKIYKDVKVGSDIDKATLSKIYDKLNAIRGKVVN